MKNIHKLVGIVLWVVTCACSKSNDEQIAVPEMAYSQGLVAIFFVPGKSTVPQINWYGDVGSFGLENAVKGISIDSRTGVISWDKTLPLGTHDLKVMAFNNAGKVSANLQVENVLEGKFQGSFGRESYDSNPIALDLIFNADGSSTLISYAYTTREVEGTWTAKYGNKLSGEYLYDGDSYYRIEGKVIHSENGFYLEGKIVSGNAIIEDSGVFRVDLVEEP